MMKKNIKIGNIGLKRFHSKARTLKSGTQVSLLPNETEKSRRSLGADYVQAPRT